MDGSPLHSKGRKQNLIYPFLANKKKRKKKETDRNEKRQEEKETRRTLSVLLYGLSLQKQHFELHLFSSSHNG